MRTILEVLVATILLSSPAGAACAQNSSALTSNERAEWSELISFTIDPQATKAFASAADGTVIAWTVTSGGRDTLLNCDGSRGSALALAAQRHLLALGDESGTLHVIPLVPPQSTEITQRLGGGSIEQVLFGPSMDSIVVIHQHQIDLWSTVTRKPIWTRKTSEELVRAAISPDGKLLALSTGSAIALRNISTGAPFRDISLNKGTAFVSDIAFTRDGKNLVVAVGNNLDIFALDGSRTPRRFTGHTDSVIAVTILDDDKRAISVGEDDTLREWDLASGTLLSTWNVVPGFVTSNGEYLVNRGSRSGDLEVWEIPTQKRLQVLSYISPVGK